MADYASMFSELLWDNCSALLRSGWKRDRNPGAPFPFGENHLRKHVQSALRSGDYVPPPTWPELFVERQVNGDRRQVGHRHGAIDYFFVPERLDRTFLLSELLATCEVKGPTRPKFLRPGSRKNWYPKIVGDLEKQSWRARYSPGAHYLAVFVQPRKGYDILADFPAVLRTMPVANVQIIDRKWSERSDIPGLYLHVFQLTSAIIV